MSASSLRYFVLCGGLHRPVQPRETPLKRGGTEETEVTQNLGLLHVFLRCLLAPRDNLRATRAACTTRYFGGKKEAAETVHSSCPPKSPPLPPFLRVSKVLLMNATMLKIRFALCNREDFWLRPKPRCVNQRLLGTTKSACRSLHALKVTMRKLSQTELEIDM